MLSTISVEGTCYVRVLLSEPWALGVPACPDGGVSFHFVAAGECWVTDGDGTLHLGAGDLVMFPRACQHVVASTPDSADVPVHELPTAPATGATIDVGGRGPRTTLVCGGTRFDPPSHPLVETLPPRMLLGHREPAEADWLMAAVRLMSLEAVRPRPGTSLILGRLMDVLVVHAIRDWLERSDHGATGWLGALRDEHLGRALVAMHHEPHRPWTISSLAREATMSRATFAERFAAATGSPPLTYLTRYRMALATTLMRQQRLTPAQAAQRVGYGSHAAFSRAYKRVVGATPARARRLVDTDRRPDPSPPE